MSNPGSLCPTIKASEVVGDKWTLLLLRELFFGATRYNQFQQALPRISPTVLSTRLKRMEASGLLVHVTRAGQKRGEYRLTPAARELAPIVDALARWGLRWARDQLCDTDLDAGTFMWDFHRSLDTSKLIDGRTTLCVILNDLDNRQWWVVADGNSVDLCNQNPGYDVDVYLSSTLPDLAAVWMGDRSVTSALTDQTLKVTGNNRLVNTVTRWFPQSSYADVRPQI